VDDVDVVERADLLKSLAVLNSTSLHELILLTICSAIKREDFATSVTRRDNDSTIAPSWGLRGKATPRTSINDGGTGALRMGLHILHTCIYDYIFLPS
jgi:hypothetical protein